MATYKRIQTTLALLLGFCIGGGCGDANTPQHASQLPTYEVHTGAPNAAKGGLEGTYSLAFTEPLALTPATQRSLALRFQLKEGGTMMVSTFAKNRVVKGEKKLREGLNIAFTRNGNALLGAFVTCCGRKIADLPPLVGFNAQEPILMHLFIDNEKPQVLIYKDKTASTPILDTEAPNTGIEEIHKGEGIHWGVSLTQGILYDAHVN